MNFVLDTNVVSNFRRARPQPTLTSWVQSQPVSSLFMSVPTVTELQCGACKANDPDVRRDVQAWIDRMLSAGQPQVLTFDVKAALLLGRMWSTPALNNFIVTDPRSRKAKSGADLAIAACAIAADMVIATHDVSDFLEIHASFPLPGIYDPFAGRWHVHYGAAPGG